ncbi:MULTISPECIES: ABC transporter ATP-binding protein [unclassified Aminobacter]|uniref:ABC transporter ATP-binding protein n=1 Tax=unclassified Aminobacter TaxID=2644704 RepID=UPI0012B07F0E|nr:ABC transporter ATP-binding protein [Aminobacter sp. MDW-2]MRX37602.1 ATP-binding cassette domain-containing protein [Aminobacter sp. MDW-2]QNH35598.1 ABC transporter ATP-binding protein [Aminobacter sp. MDW-2]
MLLKAISLSRSYDHDSTTTVALRDASFDLMDGEFVAIMGPSGSGKSTLMNIIGLLDRPTSGSLIFAGEHTANLSPDHAARLRNCRIGFVFQSYNLLGRNTALENVELPLVYAGVRRRERELRAAEALDKVGLSDKAQRWPLQLSGGEQQRIAIARALVTDPALILADEPTGALDSRTGNEIMALLQHLNEQGRTIIMVTHDDIVGSHASRIIRLQDGTIIGDQDVPDRLLTGPTGRKLRGWGVTGFG